MQAAVLDPVRTDPAVSMPLDLSVGDILYPELSEFAPPESGSADSLPAFRVDSLKKADWAVAKILDAEARIARRASLASELHARIDAWLTKASAADNDSICYLSGLLRPFVESEISMQRRSRSLVLPSGTAQLRKMPDKLDVVDKDAALSYCESSHPEAVVVRKDLSRSALKMLIVTQGEAIPGCSFELGPDELYIKSNA